MTDYVAYLWSMFAFGVFSGGLLGGILMAVWGAVSVFDIASGSFGTVSGDGGEINNDE